MLQILTHLLDVILILLAKKSISHQAHLHPLGMCESPQRTAEYDPVKTRQGFLNRRIKFGDKLLPGVSSRYMGDFDINQRTSSETPFQFAACRNAGRAILPAAGFQAGRSAATKRRLESLPHVV